MITSDSIKTRARELGFDLCGIARADSYPELSFLPEWLDRGYAATMAWMHRSANKRADVRHVVPNARSVVVTATLYNIDRPYSDDVAPDVARISRYAWSDDYHDVLKARLDALQRTQARCLVDRERLLAKLYGDTDVYDGTGADAWDLS